MEAIGGAQLKARIWQFRAMKCGSEIESCLQYGRGKGSILNARCGRFPKRRPQLKKLYKLNGGALMKITT
jgi:hypothetical protein